MFRTSDPNIFESSNGEEWSISNNRILLLHHEYPRDQLWLPFIDSLHRIEKSPKNKISGTKKPNVSRKYPLTSEDQLLYFPKHGLHQLVLPFQEAQIPSKNMFSKISAEDFPCFERDLHGQVYAARYTGQGNTNNLAGNPIIRQWVHDHCQGRVAIKSLAIFELGNDYILAILSGLFSDYRELFGMSRRPYSRQNA